MEMKERVFSMLNLKIHKRMKRIFWMAIATAALCLGGCSDSDEIDNPNPGTDPDPGSEPTENLLSYEGEMQSLAITVSGFWRVESDADWCQPGRSMGCGTQEIPLNAIYNYTGQSRRATVRIYRTDEVRSSESLAQTVVYEQQANEASEIPAHFTDAKIENNQLMFKLYTGPKSGTTEIVTGSCATWHPMGNLADSGTAREPNTETEWLTFTSVNITGDDCWAQLRVAGTPTINKLRIVQPSCQSLPDSQNENTGDVNFVLGGKLYYGGGIVSYYQAYMLWPGFVTREGSDFHCYDPATGTHTRLGDIDFSIGRAAVLDGAAYVYTGESDSQGRNLIYKYDPAADSWSAAGYHQQGSDDPVVAFYAAGGQLHVVTRTLRESYTLQQLAAGDRPSATLAHGRNFGNTRQFVDETGGVWLYDADASSIWSHTESGFTHVADVSGQLLGACDGWIYYCDRTDDSDLLYRLAADGTREQMQLIFNIREQVFSPTGSSWDTPLKYGAAIDGKLYLFGGTVRGYNPRPELGAVYTHSQTMTMIDMRNYFPADVLVTTEK